jgi:hypothetical protein
MHGTGKPGQSRCLAVTKSAPTIGRDNQPHKPALCPRVSSTEMRQSPSFKMGHRAPWNLRKGTEITPGKHEIIPGKYSHTRIKPLALASGHGRYMTVTPERALVSVGEWPLGNGRYTQPLNF